MILNKETFKNFLIGTTIAVVWLLLNGWLDRMH